MSKPDDIPQDVRSAAWDVYFKRCNSVQKLAAQFEEEEVIDLIARAIMAAKKEEREACATLCQDSRHEWAEVAAKFADAIRKRGEA